MRNEEKQREQQLRECEQLRRENSALRALEVQCQKDRERLIVLEEKYNLLLNNTNEAILIKQDDVVRFANPKANELSGYPQEELHLKPFVALIHPDDHELAMGYYRQRLQGQNPQDVYRFRFIRKNGAVGWVEAKSSLINWERRPAILYFISDITEQKQAEEALQQSERFIRSTLDALAANIAILDASGSIIDTNEAWRKFARHNGLPNQDFVGVNYLTVCDEARGDMSEDARVAAAGIRDIIAGRKDSFNMEYPCDSPEKKRWFLMRATRFKDQMEPVCVVAHVNITERRLAEEALKESREHLKALSSKLLAAQEEERRRIAAELHDSIGASLGAINFTLSSALNQTRRDSDTTESIERLISMVQQTGDEIRRIISDLRPSMLDDLGILPTIGWFIRQFQAIYSHIHIQKKIAINEQDVPECLKIVIFRVMQETFHNAAKHSKAKLITISLTKSADIVELVIKDDGVGFDMQVACEKKDVRQSLGLTSMRERVELSGGAFSIESAIGQGTVIRAAWDTGRLEP